ncbi:acyl-thioesterase [Podospora conica]|nr:acyl-thioesterase [Schizothecium conicum]
MSSPDPRLSFQEVFELVKLPPAGSDKTEQRFMSKRAAYVPGADLPQSLPRPHKAAFGGHVYGQAALAVSRTLRELEDQKGTKPSERLGFHSIHGYFTSMGYKDRPFIYDVKPVSVSRSFSTVSVTARQPAVPSTNPEGDHYPVADAALAPGPVSFTAICSFKSSEEHSDGASIQEDPVQKRFASILSSRRAQDWPPSPLVDIDAVVSIVGNHHVGTFPIVDMKKVDMAAFNEGKPVHERVELILYRLLKPLPSDGTDGYDANAHMAVHGYTVDRNGLLMLGNHLGFGWKLGKVASLTYSLVVHVNADEMVMEYGEDEWWVQESTFPRAGAGRGVIMSKIWSPRGVHVATEYQDGLVRSFGDEPQKMGDKAWGKL